MLLGQSVVVFAPVAHQAIVELAVLAEADRKRTCSKPCVSRAGSAHILAKHAPALVDGGRPLQLQVDRRPHQGQGPTHQHSDILMVGGEIWLDMLQGAIDHSQKTVEEGRPLHAGGERALLAIDQRAYHLAQPAVRDRGDRQRGASPGAGCHGSSGFDTIAPSAFPLWSYTSRLWSRWLASSQPQIGLLAGRSFISTSG